MRAMSKVRAFRLTAPVAPEDELHHAALKLLRMALPDDALVFHCPNGGARTVQAGARMKALGTLAGIPDLLIVWRGRLFCLELKSSVGRRSAVQIATHDRLQAAAVPVATCASIEAVIDALAGWAIPVRVRLAA
jgi:hypothetical protein